MTPQQESALETCQHVHTILREAQQRVLVPGTEMLAQWETELGRAAALLEKLLESMTDERAPRRDPALQKAIQEIQRTADRLQAQFEHGSNFCMGLLQLRLGTGYSEHGLPVLMATQARGTFEG
jgi:hypothetical protein